jgi:hypothetical protein
MTLHDQLDRLTRNPMVRLCVIEDAAITVIGQVDWPEPRNEPIPEFDPDEPEPDDLYYAMLGTLSLARVSGKRVFWFPVPRRWRLPVQRG